MNLFDQVRKAMNALFRVIGIKEQTSNNIVYLPITAWDDSGPFRVAMSGSNPATSLQEALAYIAETYRPGGRSKYYVIMVNRTLLQGNSRRVAVTAMYRIFFNGVNPFASEDMGARTIEFTNLES